MKRYRPSTKSVVIGIVIMIAGILCWGIVAPLKNNPNFFSLFPLGLILICIGGLELTITALNTVHKNDLAMREAIKKREAEEKAKKEEQK